jgi:hypothetical protein
MLLANYSSPLMPSVGMGWGIAQIFTPRLLKNLEEMMPGARVEIFTAPIKNIFNELHE